MTDIIIFSFGYGMLTFSVIWNIVAYFRGDFKSKSVEILKRIK